MNDPNAASDLVICPNCQAARSATKPSCWLCGAQLPEPGDTSGLTRPNRINVRPKYSFSLATLFLVTTLSAVLLGVFVVAPGAGILLSIVMLPVIIRTGTVLQRRKELGKETSTGRILSMVLLSSLMALWATLILSATVVAAVAGFCAVLCGAMGSGGRGEAASVFSMVCLGIPIIIGMVFLWVHVFRKRYRRDLDVD